MQPEEAAERFAELFHAVFLRFHDRRLAHERPLSPEALSILEHLSRTGPLTVTEAARHFDRSQAAISEILARLQRRGLVVRYPDERDRRRHLVWLSEAGLAAWRESQRVLSEAALADAFAALSGARRDALLRGLRSLLDQPGRPPREPGPADGAEPGGES